jgi:hypothetical protein
MSWTRHPGHPDYPRTLFSSILHDPMTAVAVVAAGVQAMGTIAQGNAQRASLDNQAAQLNQQAGEARASSQRAEENQLRTGAYAESRALAVTAASGADPNSVTAVNNEENLAGQTEYGALTALFNGEEKARGLEYEANSDYAKGKSAHDAGVISGISGFAGSAAKTMMSPTTADSGETMLDRFASNDTGIADRNNPLPWQTLGYSNPNGGFYY